MRIIHYRSENIMIHIFVKSLLGLKLKCLHWSGFLCRITLLKEACGSYYVSIGTGGMVILRRRNEV